MKIRLYFQWILYFGAYFNTVRLLASFFNIARSYFVQIEEFYVKTNRVNKKLIEWVQVLAVDLSCIYLK